MVAAGVEHAARLGVAAEHRPGPHLEQFLEAAQAAGQRDECVGPFGHGLLARVHRLTDVQLGQPAVPDFLGLQRHRDHAYDATAGRQRSVGDHAHQTHGGATVDQGDSARPKDVT